MVYRYFYDCEFIEDGRVIDLVSIGVVDEYGREFYAVSTEFDAAAAVPWVRRNVLDQLPSPGDPAWRSRERIRDDLSSSSSRRADRPGETDRAVGLVGRVRPRGARPAVGRDAGLPREIPRFTKDLRQLWDDRGRPPLPAPPPGQHDALVDARHNLARWRVMSGE